MTESSGLDDAKTGVALIGEVIKAAGTSKEAKEAASNLGKTAVTLTRFVNNALLPLAAFNYGCDKAKEYFSSGRFEQDFEPFAKKVAEEDRVPPKASIAGPALQGLAYSHDEQNLKALYMSLLAQAMDKKASSRVHPGFVEIIKQLTSEEAQLFRTLAQAEVLPIAEVRQSSPKGGYIILQRHLLPTTNVGTGEIVVVEQVDTFVDNWVRLGLAEVDYNLHLMDTKKYDWIETRPEYIDCKKQEKEGQNVSAERGVLRVTSLGLQFAQVVGII